MASQELAGRFREHLGEWILPGQRVVAAVSGGADSVALLHLLIGVRGSVNFELALCHLNHRLRGADADHDEQLVRDLSDRWSIPGYFQTIDVRTERQRRGGSLEEAARAVRYEFYRDAADHFRADKVALAHHQDDQCETILFNMIRGASLHGLRGMPQRRALDQRDNVEVIRPLLEFAKEDLLDYLRSQGIAWCEDHTNYQPTAARNILRHQVIPTLEGIQSGFKTHLLELGRTAADCERLVNEQAGKMASVIERHGGRCAIGLESIRAARPIVGGEVLRRMMIDVGVPAGRVTGRHIADMLNLVKDRCGRISLPRRCEAWIQRDRLWMGRPCDRCVDLSETVDFPDASCRFGRFLFSKAMRPFDQAWFDHFVRTKTSLQEAIDGNRVKGPLVVRYARPGDRFTPLGSPGAKKIGDFLTDHKVPAEERPAVVISDQSGPIWVVGRRIDERVRVAATTKSVLLLDAQPMDNGR